MAEIINLINSMSPYLLLGFLLAGVMRAFVPEGLYQRFLSGSSFRSVFYAAMLGVPLPLCSCGVIPTAMSLRKQGASKGATVSFLIATPQTGVDSIIATYSLMGWAFAIVRPIAAFVTAIFGGQMVNVIEKDSSVINTPAAKSQSKGFGAKVFDTLRYAFVEMMQDIGRWLILGLVVAGLITVFVPESFFALFAHNSLLSMFIVLVCAVPMYLCATGSIPIAVALMMKGLSPGTALVLLMAGPAVNVASMLVIGKVMGRKTLSLYLLSIIIGSMAFGLAIDYLLPREWFTSSITVIKDCCNTATPYFNIGCSILLIILLINAMILRFFKKKKDDCGCDACDCTTSNETTITIEGMHCNHCRASAEKAIRAVEGVEEATVDLPTATATIKGSFDLNQVVNAIDAIGFKATTRS